jgi:hypothetical protein
VPSSPKPSFPPKFCREEHVYDIVNIIKILEKNWYKTSQYNNKKYNMEHLDRMLEN